MSQFTKTDTYGKWALIVDEQFLSRICKELLDQLTIKKDRQISFEIKYADKGKLDTFKLDDLLSGDNCSGRKIIELNITATSGLETISLQFGRTVAVKDSETSYRDLTTKIVGERQWVYETKSIIEDRLDTIKESGFSWIYLYLAGILTPILLTVALFPFYSRYLPKFYIHPGLNNVNTGWDASSILLLADLLLILVIVFYLVFYYPNLVFYLGKEIQNHNRRREFRKNVTWGILVTTILGVVINIISGIFKS